MINRISNNKDEFINIGANTINIKHKVLNIIYVEYVLITLLSDLDILKAVLFKAVDNP